jgi:uncharacterized lipoprotein YddW (UPF0748 family)
MITRRALTALALPAFAAPLAPLAPARATQAFDTEIIVRTPRNLHSVVDVERLVDLAADTGVAVINVSAKQDEDDEMRSGLVFYASAIAPRAVGYESFDVLDATIRAAHRRGIKVRAWVPQFHDRTAAMLDPGQLMWAYDGKRILPFSGSGRHEQHFVNPLNPATQAYQRSLLHEIARNYEVDGIVIDWVRFDDYNMDLGDESRRRFKEYAGLDALEIDFATDNPGRRTWNVWRTRGIADYVTGVRRLIDETRRGLDFGVYILPPEFVEVAQDAGQFAEAVTFLSPMAYFRDWGKDAAWVNDNVLAQTRAKAQGTTIIPVFDCDWQESEYREILGGIRRDSPRIATLSWFAYGQWTEAIFRRIDRLRAL